MKKLSLAAAIIALLATPALAGNEAVPFPTREAVSVKVSTQDLDLSSARDRARLRTRVQKAIASACNPMDVYSAALTPDRQCFREMSANAETQLQAYAQNAYVRPLNAVETAKD